jgi:pyruvate, water dikinase
MVSSAQQATSKESKETALILWFEEVRSSDVGLVGGKNSSLGEMIQQLAAKGVNVPGGFATTAYAYRHFIKGAGLDPNSVRFSPILILMIWITCNNGDNKQDL